MIGARRLKAVVPGSALLWALGGGFAPAMAQTTATAFADIDPGPRIMAMGGAAVAGVSDPTAAYWNPAGLYFMRGSQASATYDDLYGLGLVKRNFLGFAMKKVVEEPRFTGNRMALTRDLDRGTAWALSLSSVLVDLGGETYSEFMPAVSVAGGFDDDLSLGASISYLRAGSRLDGASAGGYTLSLGSIVSLPGPGRAGLSVRNLVSRVFRDGDLSERLRLTPTLGVYWPFLAERGIAAGDVTWVEGASGPARISVGGEFRVLPALAARAGLRRYSGTVEDRTVPSFGAGVRWSRLEVDYAFTADEDGPGSTHRFGVNVALSRPE